MIMWPCGSSLHSECMKPHRFLCIWEIKEREREGHEAPAILFRVLCSRWRAQPHRVGDLSLGSTSSRSYRHARASSPNWGPSFHQGTIREHSRSQQQEVFWDPEAWTQNWGLYPQSYLARSWKSWEIISQLPSCEQVHRAEDHFWGRSLTLPGKWRGAGGPTGQEEGACCSVSSEAHSWHLGQAFCHMGQKPASWAAPA